jgi:eukaryotic-like serine/threonine-protein kinase
MSPEASRVRSIFLAAVESVEPARWTAYLDEQCAGDAELRRQVEILLQAHQQANSLLDAPLGATIDEPGNDRPGATIGPYKLLEPIGEGGMGTVWMAQQSEPIKRQVAIKLIKPGMDSKQVLARFDAERQALALMDHPNIAKVFDAGTTGETEPRTLVSSPPQPLTDVRGSGRPYFVMELVKGIPITKYCDELHLTPRQRLELFIPVCQAIQHAHQKGIIHRDIKPSNVLIAMYDDRPVPKVIDFGVAKATGQQLTEATLHTGFGAVVGTIEYMSPEQASFNQLDVDTRSDIYSLGVLLYELLAGSPPFTKKELEKAGMMEMLRVIREQEPSKPSTKLSSSDALPSLSANRGTEPSRLTKLVRGELDWIVMKALEKDRSRRYETANGFAMDVQRYLADEPVQACPPSAGYRFKKFTRRNRVKIAVAGLILLVLFTLTGGIAWNVRDRAARQAALEQEVNLAFEESERLQAQAKWPEALSAAKRAEGLLAGGAGDELRKRIQQLRKDVEMVLRVEEIPLLRSDFKEDRWDFVAADQAYAKAFADYGIDVPGLPVEEAVARIRSRPSIADTLVAAVDDWAFVRGEIDRAGGSALRAVARAADADPWRQQVRDAAMRKDTRKLTDLAASRDLLRQPPTSLLRLSKNLRALGLTEAEIKVLRQAQLQYPGDFWINYNLAWNLANLAPPSRDEAIAFYRAALAVRPQNAMVFDNLGRLLRDQKKLDEAEACYRKAVEYDARHVSAWNGLGALFCDERRDYDGAIACFNEAIRLKPDYAVVHHNMGVALRAKKDIDGAIASFKQAVRLDPDNAGNRVDLGDALSKRGKLDEAIASYREWIRVKPDDATAHRCLGDALTDQNKLEEAVVSYEAAIRLKRDYPDAYVNLGNALARLGKRDDAIAAFREAIRIKRDDALAHGHLGEELLRKGLVDEGIAELREARRLDHNDYGSRYLLGVTLCDKKGDYDGAIAALREAIRLKSDSVNAYSSLGVALRRKGLLDESIAAHREAVRLKQDEYYSHYLLGFALHLKCLHEESAAAYGEAIRLNAKHADSCFGLGNALDKLNKLDEAIHWFKKAIEIDQKHALAHYNLGLVFSRQGKLDEAIAWYRIAIKLDPKYASAHNNLGYALYLQGKLEEAIAAYRKAIELDPKDAIAHFNLGNALHKHNKLSEAVDAFRKYIELRPKHAPAYYNLGLALRAQGKPEAAIAAFKQAVALNPNWAGAHYHLAWELTVGHELKLRDPRQALVSARLAVELDPKNGTYWQGLGYAEYRSGNWKAAILAFEKVKELGSPGDSVEWFPLAMANWQLGDKDVARKTYDQAVQWMEKNCPTDPFVRGLQVEAAELMGIKIMKN